MTGEQKHDKSILLRLTADDIERLDALVGSHGVTTRTALARAALRIGLDSIEQDPSVLLGQPVAKRGGARRRKNK